MWFIIHTYQRDLDVVAKQKEEDRGFGTTVGVNSKTFKKMLNYFELQTSKQQKQIALQKDVSLDIKEYLDVDSGIRSMIFGGLHRPLGFDDNLNKSVADKSGLLDVSS